MGESETGYGYPRPRGPTGPHGEGSGREGGERRTQDKGDIRRTHKEVP
jgi:hypothetical protein